MEDLRNIAFLSGGFNSSAMVVKVLQDEPQTITDIIHLIIKKETIDWQKELEQSRTIIEHLKNKFTNFTYKEYVFDVTGLVIKTHEAIEIYSGFIVTRSKNHYKNIYASNFKSNPDFFGLFINNLTQRNLFTTAIFNVQPYCDLGNTPIPTWSNPINDILEEDLEKILRECDIPLSLFNKI